LLKLAKADLVAPVQILVAQVAMVEMVVLEAMAGMEAQAAQVGMEKFPEVMVEMVGMLVNETKLFY
jgi:hypothetical protein